MRPDRSNPLVSELRGLSNRELRLTLRELSSQERAQVLQLLDVADPAEPAPSFETLVGLSPWLLKAVDETKLADGRTRFTPATRSALLRALQEAASSPDKPDAPETAGSGTFIGRMLARRKSGSTGA